MDKTPFTRDYLLKAGPGELIEAVNTFTPDEARRCRILLAALLYRLEETR